MLRPRLRPQSNKVGRMFIKQIEVRNFKSFKHLKLNLQNLNILVGANAAGKSNFVSILKFIRNIARYGLIDAISLEGGAKHLLNGAIGKTEELHIKLIYTPVMPSVVGSAFVNERKEVEYNDAEVVECIYDFSLAFQDRDDSFVVTHDSLTFYYELSQSKDGNSWSDKGRGHFRVEIKGERIHVLQAVPAGFKTSPENLFPLIRYNDHPLGQKKHLLLETPYFQIAHEGLEVHFEAIGVYNINPHLSQQAVLMTGKTELEDDANNLVFVLNKVLAESSNGQTFNKLLNYFLPQVVNAHIETLANRLLLNLQETYQANNIPAFLLSDGTVGIVALILILYFDTKQPLSLEEPDRHLHPQLIEKLVYSLNEASAKKQIIVTTHNPELVKHASLEQLLLISRGRDGFSDVTRPVEQETVQVFMANEIGIDDLFVNNLLGVPA